MTNPDFDVVDYFRAPSLYQDPYPYYEYLRAHGPVWCEPKRGVAMVTGYDEAISVYNNTRDFSNCSSVAGPFTKFPVPLEGDDISAIIEQYRDDLPFSDQLPTFDPPKHTAHRGLLMRLITPKRLKENEDFMWHLADRQIDTFLPSGRCDFVTEYANPFTLLVIADLLGVPDDDHDVFREQLQGDERPVNQPAMHKPLEFLYERFTEYIADRRREPRDDVMTGLATATFPDGRLPEVQDVMLIASNLFAAGQETTARLMSTALRFLGEQPDVQQRLRAERDAIPNFIEECLRIESPIQGEFRLARLSTRIGDLDIPAGTYAYICNGAANRDPRHFDHPAELDVDRPNVRQHVGFGFGIHVCAGSPLARAEARVSLERLFDRTTDITISETEHGPPGDRRFEYTPIFLLRGLEHLHLEFT